MVRKVVDSEIHSTVDVNSCDGTKLYFYIDFTGKFWKAHKFAGEESDYWIFVSTDNSWLRAFESKSSLRELLNCVLESNDYKNHDECIYEFDNFVEFIDWVIALRKKES
jgi:hypothetical protein